MTSSLKDPRSALDAPELIDRLDRIANALERMSPPPLGVPEFQSADAFVWHIEPDALAPVDQVNRIDLPLLVGID